MNAVTVILNRAQQGDPKAAGELPPMAYDELRCCGFSAEHYFDLLSCPIRV
jgi:hypothetical protein